MALPSVFAVVLSFNGTKDTLACIDTLLSQDYAALHLLVVDNASSDGAPEAIRSAFPAVEVVALPTNLGWAGGNNVGIRLALERGADLVCLLNNDLVLAEDSIGKMVDAATKAGKCLMHPSIYYYHDREVPQLDPVAQNIGEIFIPSETGENIWKIGYSYGACLMVKSEVFKTIGLFDEDFFLQLEEEDFYRRATAAGIPSLCLPAARVWHKESASFGGQRTPMKTYYSVRNRLLLIEKHEGIGSARFFQSLKKLYWQIKILHQTEGTGHFWPWLLFGDRFAQAIRFALRDYLVRRFGAIRPDMLGRLAGYK